MGRFLCMRTRSFFMGRRKGRALLFLFLPFLTVVRSFLFKTRRPYTDKSLRTAFSLLLINILFEHFNFLLLFREHPKFQAEHRYFSGLFQPQDSDLPLRRFQHKARPRDNTLHRISYLVLLLFSIVIILHFLNQVKS